MAADAGGAVYDFDSQHHQLATKPTPTSRLPTAGRIAHRRTQLSRSDRGEISCASPRWIRAFRSLAAQITGSASNDYDKAAAIENYLRTRFGYTLQLPQTAVKDPIANFLFERKQGHCEYFASAMAVMLRTLGIPSRVVNGFRSDEFNDLTGNYVVRAKDAHPGSRLTSPAMAGRHSIPLPQAPNGTPQGWERLALYIDAMASFWRDWIVSYDTSHQYALGQAAVQRHSRSLGPRACLGASAIRFHAASGRAAVRIASNTRPAAGLSIAVAIAFVFLLLGNIGRIVRLLHEKWLRAHPERSPEQAAAMWYRRMARVLARRGVEKPAAQTPQEFVRKIEDGRLREPVARFTEVIRIRPLRQFRRRRQAPA